MKVILNISNKKSGTSELALALHKNILIGRSNKSHHLIDDDKVSGAHCRFFLKNDRLEIFDADSKNGTYLNGIRIEQSEIFLGDEIKIGDTLITFSEDKMDSVSKETLTFPGPYKDRLNYELKADFTGARILNQIYNKEHPEDRNSNLQLKELNLRKKARSKIRLSKQEIKSRHRMITLLANCVDFALLLGVIFIPIFVVNSLAKEASIFQEQQILIITVSEIVLVGLFIAMNVKFLKYSFGEKLMGIEDLHSKQ